MLVYALILSTECVHHLSRTHLRFEKTDVEQSFFKLDMQFLYKSGMGEPVVVVERENRLLPWIEAPHKTSPLLYFYTMYKTISFEVKLTHSNTDIDVFHQILRVDRQVIVGLDQLSIGFCFRHVALASELPCSTIAIVIIPIRTYVEVLASPLLCFLEIDIKRKRLVFSQLQALVK